MTLNIHQGLCIFNYVEFSAGLGVLFKGIIFMGHSLLCILLVGGVAGDMRVMTLRINRCAVAAAAL